MLEDQEEEMESVKDLSKVFNGINNSRIMNRKNSSSAYQSSNLNYRYPNFEVDLSRFT